MSSLEHQINSSRTSFEENHDFGVGGTTLAGMPQNMVAYAMQPSQHSPQVAQNYGYPTATSAEMQSEGQVKSNDPAQMFPGGNNAVGIQNGQGQDLGWPSAYQANSQENYMFTMNNGSNMRLMKSETEMMPNNLSMTGGAPHDGIFSGLYSNAASFGENQIFDTWDLDPLENKAQVLLAFCFPDGVGRSERDSHNEAKLRTLLTATSIKTFMEHFNNFQGHWPMIHMPSFNPINANNCLLLTMICIGAVYSDAMDVLQVRWLMELVKNAVHRSSRVFGLISGQATAQQGQPQQPVLDVDEINALILLQCLFTWHGNQAQRHYAREEFWKVAAVARQSGLLNPLPPTSSGYSILHQPNQDITQQHIQMWNWESWVEQEKRCRTMFLIYLLDAAMVIFFNCTPQFDASEIRLPLPADDAAWEAKTAADCATALGLNGRTAQESNVTGSRRFKQPEFRSALRALMDSTADFKPRSTNVYSKFILMHALHVRIWSTQRHASPCTTLSGLAGFNGLPSSGTSTPLSQNDWLAVDGSNGTVSTANSGPATPESILNFNPQANSHLQKIQYALEKWKRSWDPDMNVQYPPSQSKYRRIGFCRDAIHFYYLAMQFLRSSRPQDWQIPADNRFAYVMKLLKNIKSWVASDNEQRGQDIGSIGEIDDNYGVEDLTLDMKLLFTPILAQSALPNARTDHGNNDSMTGESRGNMV